MPTNRVQQVRLVSKIVSFDFYVIVLSFWTIENKVRVLGVDPDG